MSQGKLRQYYPLLWMLAIPILNIFYGILNRPGMRTYDLSTRVDEMLPFLPVFVIPYLIWYPFIAACLVTLFYRNRATYYRTLFALCLGLVISYIFFYFYQSGITRPQLGEGFLYSLVQFVYHNDAPYNCFPSIHVLTTYLMIKSSKQAFPHVGLRWTIHLLAWSIILSTVFVKQHVLLDIAGGIAVAEITYFVIGLVPAWARSRSRNPGKAFGASSE
ncbi:phosphatase PAP2 family protein [Paenibacillus sp. GCM10012303]|uniref:phosphatase PAP2 family protein n=1 Tax=Paenibacillus sp. GCM10012303 TaxID=3317340 RepID=UPI003606FB14